MIMIFNFTNCSADLKQCENAVTEDRLSMKNVRIAIDSGNISKIQDSCKHYVLTNKKVQNYCSSYEGIVSTAKTVLLEVSKACRAKGININ